MSRTSTPESNPSESNTPSDASLLGVLDGLRQAGYDTDLRPGDRPGTLRCDGCGSDSAAASFEDLRVRRLEGASDPDDMLLAVGGRCPRCGRAGNVVLGFGPNSSEVDATIVAELPLRAGAQGTEESIPAPARLARAIGGWSSLDLVADRVADWWGRVPEPALEQLRGRALGHPLHPVATDLPIGFWTSAWVLDLLGGRRARRPAEVLVGLGVASALPTVATGLSDFLQLDRSGRRIGVVHAGSNAVATALYVASYLARRGGNHRRGVALGHLGAASATVGGFLGGHLAFGHRAEEGDATASAGRDRP